MLTDLTGPSSNGTQEAAKARRRRRPADSGNQAKNQMFYFVDSNSSSKEKRAHVMRHHVQEKRKQRKLSHESLHTAQTEEPQSPLRKDFEYDTDRGKVEALTGMPRHSVNQDPSVGISILFYDLSGREDVKHETRELIPAIQLPIRFSSVKSHFQPATSAQATSPGATLGTPRNDPFSTVPAVHDSRDSELMDYWTSRLTYWSGQNPHVKNQVFRTAMQHPVSFQAVILAYCARWKAQLEGITDSKEVRRHVGQTRKNIEDATLGTLQVPADQLAMTMAGMAIGEERFGSKKDAREFLDRAVRILRPRAGTNMAVEVFVQYVRYMISPPPDTVVDLDDRRWLVTFLQGAEDLMRKHSSPEYHLHTPQRREAFQMESPLFPLLSSGPRPSQVPHAVRMYVVSDDKTQEVSRTAALIFITAALWDFKDSPCKTGRFLNYLHTLVKQHQLDRHPAGETLLWLLLEQECDPDLRDPERAWATGELVRTHRLLRPDLQFLFNEILMSFLSLRTPIRGIDIFEQELAGS